MTAPTRAAVASKTSALSAESRKPVNSRLGVSPLKYQSKSTPPPRPSAWSEDGSGPVMYPSTDVARAVKTLGLFAVPGLLVALGLLVVLGRLIVRRPARWASGCRS